MVKILTQSGASLADIYDVQGSIAGIEQLETKELPIVHEMGATVFSERLFGQILRGTTGALLQNATWDITIAAPAAIYRVLGVFMFVDTAARTSIAQVSLRAIGTNREMPISIWNASNDVESSLRFQDNGAAIGTSIGLVQNRAPIMPSLGISDGQLGRVGDEIVFRGLTTGFGAGNLTAVALIYVGSSAITPAISSFGLPIPGW